MNEEEKKEVSWQQLSYSLDRIYSENAIVDNRVSIAISFSSLVFTLAGLLLSAKFAQVKAQSEHHFYAMIILGALAGGFFLASSIFFLRALVKETSRKKKKETYCFHYADIHSFSREEDYRNVCHKTSQQEYFDQLVHEIYMESNICQQKHKLFRRGLICVFVFMSVVFAMAIVIGLSMI